MAPDKQKAIGTQDGLQLLQRLSQDISVHSRRFGIRHGPSVQILTSALKVIIFGVEALAQSGRSHRVDNNVMGNASQPGPQARFTPEAADARIGAAEHFLG
jgi:hypothetical protein